MHEGGELLLVVGHVGRECDDVPVHVCVALLTPEAQDVDAFGGNRPRQRSADGTNEGLHREVVVEWKVLDDVFSVCDRCDEDVAALDVEVRQERDVVVISVDDELSSWGFTGHDAAHEAVTTSGAFDVGGSVERNASIVIHRESLALPRRACGRVWLATVLA